MQCLVSLVMTSDWDTSDVNSQMRIGCQLQIVNPGTKNDPMVLLKYMIKWRSCRLAISTHQAGHGGITSSTLSLMAVSSIMVS